MAITNRTESRNFSATSSINDKPVMYMTANYTDSGNLSFNESIQDMTAYKANMATVDADYETWKAEVKNEVLGE